jgi:hypothetical protein
MPRTLEVLAGGLAGLFLAWLAYWLFAIHV